MATPAPLCAGWGKEAKPSLGVVHTDRSGQTQRAEEGSRMALYIVVNVAIVVVLGILARLIGR